MTTRTLFLVGLSPSQTAHVKSVVGDLRRFCDFHGVDISIYDAQLHFAVREVASGEQAAAACRQNMPAGILINSDDLKSALELVKTIRGLSNGEAVRIMLSHHGELAGVSYRDGVNAFLDPGTELADWEFALPHKLQEAGLIPSPRYSGD